jgi:pSer/pThr/pTyr-binding forkhead associated (FHA) protein
MVSRDHAHIRFEQQKWSIYDGVQFPSTNGIFRKLEKKKKYTFIHGDSF